ncbi:MAG: methyltransferase domain-containing protein [bacterium]|nr:methyltransferase domain-containing protein [bacterium]
MNKNKKAVAIFNRYAKLYQDKFMDVNLYGDTFDYFCRAIKTKDADILEIACGPGNITRYLLNQRPDFNLLGTDLAPQMLELARINNPEANFKKMDGRDILTLNKKFDGLMCGFFLPYLSKVEVEKLFSDASKILKPTGVIYISTMEDDYDKSGLRTGSTGEEMYMHYYEAKFLTSTLIQNKFKILKMERKESFMTDGSKVCDVILIAAKL